MIYKLKITTQKGQRKHKYNVSFSAPLCLFTWEFSSIEPFPVGDVSIHTYSPESCPVAVFSTWEIHSKGLCWSLLLRRLTKNALLQLSSTIFSIELEQFLKLTTPTKDKKTFSKVICYSYLQVLYRYSNSTFYIFRIISNCKNVNNYIRKRFQIIFPCSLSLH